MKYIGINCICPLNSNDKFTITKFQIFRYPTCNKASHFRMVFSLLLLLSLTCSTHGLINVEKDDAVDTNSIEEETNLAPDTADGADSSGEVESNDVMNDNVIVPYKEEMEDDFVIFTVASEDNDPLQRYVRSLRVFGMDKYLQVWIF